VKRAKLLIIPLILSSSLQAKLENITLDDAKEILRSQNLEIKTSQIDIDTALQDTKTATAKHFGKLDFVQDFARSNDAGNVFGFKLSSREANFGDFGADEFMNNMGACQGGDMGACADLYTKAPDNLNYPGYRNYFQSKLQYEIPLFTGFMISSYEGVLRGVAKIRSLESSKVQSQKLYELKKSFYDMKLLKESQKNLNIIYSNIKTLENMTSEMINEGYAKRVDLLEVKAKKGNVKRLLDQMDLNEKLLYQYLSFLLNEEVASIKLPAENAKIPTATTSDALQNSLDIQMIDEAVALNRQLIDASKASYYPMVGAFAQISSADEKFLKNLDDHKSYTIGARASWNLFNGGADSAAVQKAKLELLKRKTEADLARSGIELQFSKITTEIESYNKEIASLKEELALADEIYENYETRYKEKLVSMSDVIIKQSEQIQKILQLQQRTNERNERVFALEQLLNGDRQ